MTILCIIIILVLILLANLACSILGLIFNSALTHIAATVIISYVLCKKLGLDKTLKKHFENFVRK